MHDVKFKKILTSVENNQIKDNSFDYTIANATIHHCSKPHLCVLEMFRIAKKGILIVEGNDCLFTKIACYFKISETFEKSAIKNGKGGVDNTKIPNYIYRWTEREIKKLIFSYKPDLKNKFYFDYSFDIENIKKKKIINFMILPLIKVILLFFKKQGNLFSVFIKKT